MPFIKRTEKKRAKNNKKIETYVQTHDDADDDDTG